jgi:serine/threonine protein phosphatase 1
MNRYVLGDLHGNYRALKEVIRKSAIDKDKDELYFLGDLADSYPEPEKCLHELLSFKYFYPIIGNHDLFLKKWLYSGQIDKRWVKLNGLQTIKKFEGHEDYLKEYFEKAKYYHLINDTFLCHGGFNHKRIITKQKMLNFAINRTLYQVSFQYKRSKIKFKPVFNENNDSPINRIIIGHSVTPNYLPSFNSNLINIDTGAGNGGKLTIMDLDSLKYYQSSYSKSLY